MMWEDLLIDRRVTDGALVQAVAGVFAIRPEETMLVGAIEDAPAAMAAGTRALIVRAPAAGDFPLQVTVYLHDDDLERRVQARPARLELVKRFTGLLGCAALVGDESPDPLTWLLVHPTGAVEPVTLDPDRLEDEAYVVAARQPSGHPAETVA